MTSPEMRKDIVRIIWLASLAIIALCAPVDASPKLSDVIASAVADPARPADCQGRDPLRKPAGTLAFAGVRPGMTVGEFYPGGGYFTRMLSGIVGPSGHVYGIDEIWKGAVDADKAAPCRWQIEDTSRSTSSRSAP